MELEYRKMELNNGQRSTFSEILERKKMLARHQIMEKMKVKYCVYLLKFLQYSLFKIRNKDIMRM